MTQSAEIEAVGQRLLISVVGLGEGGASIIECPAGSDAGFQISNLRLAPAADSIRQRLSSAIAAGASHALLMDANDHLLKADIATFIRCASQRPEALFVGVRPGDFPASRFQTLRNLLLRLETGSYIGDVDGRPILAPRKLLELLLAAEKGPTTITELLARAHWMHCPVERLELSDRAPTPLQFVQSQSPLRILLTHVRLVLRELSGLPHPRYVPRGPRALFWATMKSWFDPRPIWRALRAGEANRLELSLGVAVGAYIACMPTPGAQTFIALYAAKKLHLHPIAVVMGSHAAMPPVGIALFTANTWIGHLLLHGTAFSLADLREIKGHLLSHGAGLILDCIVGSVPLGLFVATILFVITLLSLRLIPMRDANASAV